MKRQLNVCKLILQSLAILVIACSATGQSLERSKIELRTRLVLIDVLVTEKKTGAVVGDLLRDNFEVLADRKPRTLTHFSANRKRRPLALMLILDLSPKNSGRFLRQSEVVESLAAPLSKLSPGDEVAIIALWVGGVGRNKQNLVEFTTDHAKIREGLMKVPALVGAYPISVLPYVSVPELLFEAAELAKSQKRDSKVVMVYVSDGFVLTHSSERQHGVEIAHQGNLMFSAILCPARKAAIALSAPFVPLGLALGLRPNGAEYFAEQTGGLAVKVQAPKDYATGLGKIIEGLSSSYTLGFELDPSEPDDGRLHRLDVKVKARDRSGKQRKLEVAARRGYFLPKHQDPVAQRPAEKEKSAVAADKGKREADEKAIRKSVYDLHYSVMTGDVEGVKRLTAKRTLDLYMLFFDLAFKKLSGREGREDIPATSGDEFFKLILGLFADASKDASRAQQIREKAQAQSEARITFTGDQTANIEYSDGVSAKAVFEDGLWKIDETEKLKEQLLKMDLFTQEQKEQIKKY